MADANKSRGIQLLRTDDSVAGAVSFYDRRQANVAQAFIAKVSMESLAIAAGVTKEALAHDGMKAVLRAAVHGVTQNILDASTKLEGDARVKFVRDACRIVQNGGWASAPVDEEKLRENTISAMMKLGFTREAAIAALNTKKA
jgi:hypothetical protein